MDCRSWRNTRKFQYFWQFDCASGTASDVCPKMKGTGEFMPATAADFDFTSGNGLKPRRPAGGSTRKRRRDDPRGGVRQEGDPKPMRSSMSLPLATAKG
jgi:hypothetical protein